MSNIDPNDPTLRDLASMAKFLSQFSERPVSYNKLWHYLRDNNIETVKKGAKIYTRRQDIRDMPVTVTIRFLEALAERAIKVKEETVSVQKLIEDEVRKQIEAAKVDELMGSQRSKEDERQMRLINQAFNDKESEE